LSQALSRHVAASVLVIAVAGLSAAGFSLSKDPRYRAVSEFRLSRTPSNADLDRTLAARAKIIAERLRLAPSAPRPTLMSASGRATVKIVVEASDPNGLTYIANSFASDFRAHELGPAIEATQIRYRRLQAAAEALPADDERRARVERRLLILRARVVTDAHYKPAADATPFGVMPVIVSVPLAMFAGLWLASAAALSLDRLTPRDNASRRADVASR